MFCVPMIGRTEENGINIISLQNFPVIFRGENIITKNFFRSNQSRIIAVGRRYQFYTRNLQGGWCIKMGDDSHPDGSNLDLIICLKLFFPVSALKLLKPFSSFPTFRGNCKSGQPKGTVSQKIFARNIRHINSF